MPKLLVLKVSSMGDIIHSFPALRDAKQQIEDLECHWVVENSFSDIARLNQDIDNIIIMNLRRWRKELHKLETWREIKSFLAQLREQEYDYIIDPQGLLKTAFLSLIARGKSYGYDKDSIRENSASIFYNHKIAAHDEHAITKIRTMFQKILGYQPQSGLPRYALYQEHIELPYVLPNNYIMFLHGTSRANKCWQESKWIDLARLYSREEKKVVLTYGDNAEYHRAQRIVSASDNVVCLPRSSLWELAYVIRNANGLVGLDTGFTHLAAAYEVPMVSLYGPTTVEHIGTIGNNQKHLDLYTITPDEVLDNLADLINNRTAS